MPIDRLLVILLGPLDDGSFLLGEHETWDLWVREGYGLETKIRLDTSSRTCPLALIEFLGQRLYLNALAFHRLVQLADFGTQPVQLAFHNGRTPAAEDEHNQCDQDERAASEADPLGSHIICHDSLQETQGAISGG